MRGEGGGKGRVNVDGDNRQLGLYRQRASRKSTVENSGATELGLVENEIDIVIFCRCLFVQLLIFRCLGLFWFVGVLSYAAR